MRLLLSSWLVLMMGLAPAGQNQRQERVSVETLVYELQHPDPNTRKRAAQLLGENRVAAAVPALLRLTEDPETSVRLEAVRALTRINDQRALPAYIQLTRDGNTEIQRRAVEGIINLYVVEETGFISGIRKFAQFVNPFSDDYNPLAVEPYVRVDGEAIQAISEMLRSRDKSIRENAAMGLGVLRGHSALPAIRQALSVERDSGVRIKLIRAIYKIADAQAAVDLVPLIDDSDRRVRDEAIVTLGRLRVREAVPRLKLLYEAGVTERRRVLRVVPASGADDLQRRMLEALADIGDPSCREIFLEALQDDRESYRRSAAEGLARIGDSGIITQIGLKYVREQSPSAKLAMSYALYRLGREEHLLELIDQVTTDQAYYYLLEFAPEQIRLLHPHVPDTRDAVTARLLDVIGLKGDLSSMPLLENMTRSSSTDVVSAANLAIRRLRGRFDPV